MIYFSCNNPVYDGLTPLHADAFNGHLKINKLITEMVEKKNSRWNTDCLTPLHVLLKKATGKYVSKYIMLVVSEPILFYLREWDCLIIVAAKNGHFNDVSLSCTLTGLKSL